MGLSDFHKMVLVVLNKKIEKTKPKVISYRDYRYFDGNSFIWTIRFEMSKISTHSYSPFEKVFLEMIMLPWNKKQSVPVTPLIWRKLIGKQWSIEANWKQNKENNQQILTPSFTEDKRIFGANYIKKKRRNIIQLLI